MKGFDNLSDPIRASIEFYHSYLVDGNGMGTVVMHLPQGMVGRANSLVGSVGMDVHGVLLQAMNLGLQYLLEDTVRQDVNARKVLKAKVHYTQEVSNQIASR